ncbi:MAG: toprim domain-containing protein, partial [Bacteroidaceae bacterium]
SMHQCGIENVVANSGTALNDAQIRLLKRFTDNITLIYDGDEAGIHAALRGTDMLLAQNMNVKVLLLPDGDDPDSFARKHNAQQFREYVTQNQTDFIIFKINHLLSQASNDPRKRSEVTESILQSISVIPDEIVRSTYLHECSEMMNMDEQMLLRRCLQLIRQHREQKQKEKEREQQRLEYLEKKKQAGETPAAVEAQTNGQPQAGDVPQAMQQDIPEETNAQTQLGTIAPPVQPTTPRMDAYQPQAEQTNDKDMAKILGMETLIMRMIVRYGEFKLIFEDADGEKTQVPVARFVKEELEVDGMNFQNQMYVRMMDSILGRVDDAEFSCSKFFLTSTDLEVSAFAANMLNDKYQLDSKALVEPEESTLSTSIPRLLLDYKFYVVRREIQMLKKQLTDRNVICDSEKMMEVMKRSKFLMDIQKKLAKELGDRIVSA